MNLKEQVKEFWEKASCGEELYFKGIDESSRFRRQMSERYRLEPHILHFAEFDKFRGKKVLEIGVGLGSDHQKLAEAGTELYGIDLTARAIDHTKRRLELFGLHSELSVGDAEDLAFEADTFNFVYSWGVIHHSPDTAKCVQEIHRVLKPGGQFKVMIYHKNSIVGYLLWLRYALCKLKPYISLQEIYGRYLESPGTKAYSIKEAKLLFTGFKDVSVRTVLSHGDLLSSQAGQRHRGFFISLVIYFFPRRLIRVLLKSHGSVMMIQGSK